MINSNPMNEQLEFLKLIVLRLDSASIPYMMTGSMAMATYAAPRMTRDIDLVIECQAGDATRIAKLFEGDCYVDEAAIRDAINKRSTFNIIHNEWIVKADFIVRKDEEYRKIEFDRRKKFDIEGAAIWVASPEDLILSKLLWIKDSESELQRRDIRTILDSVSDLDWPYLEKWSSTLRVKSLLDEVKGK
jgi:hypothetical protein